MDNEQNTAEETAEIKEEPVKILKDNLLTEKQKKMQKALRWILITVGSLMMALSVYFSRLRTASRSAEWQALRSFSKKRRPFRRVCGWR